MSPNTITASGSVFRGQVNFRLSVLRSLDDMSGASMQRWVNESYFRANLEEVEYSIPLRNQMTREVKKGVCPDGYFEILDEERREQQKPHELRFLLEMDMSTHDNLSFGREKAAAGAAYVKKKIRESNHHIDRIFWLIITNGGKKRLNNLKKQTLKYAGGMADIFYFTNLHAVQKTNIFLDPIWSHVNEDHPVSIY